MEKKPRKQKKGYILLKWGTLKGWDFSENEEASALFKEYCAIGSSMSAMMQKDTPRQKELICQMIDLVPGKITEDWGGKQLTKKAAKEYVMNY